MKLKSLKYAISYFIEYFCRSEIRYIKRLKKKGLNVGANFNIQPGAIIDESHCFLISIGNDVTIAPHAYILAHDASIFKYIGYTKIGLVSIGDKVFVGAYSIILPNIKIGNNVIIGCGSIVTKDVPDNCVVAGNPAVIIGKTDEYIDRHMINLMSQPKFSKYWTMRYYMNNEMKKTMRQKLMNGIGYVE